MHIMCIDTHIKNQPFKQNNATPQIYAESKLRKR